MRFYDGKTVLVAGGGGFIGGHLVRRLAGLSGTAVRAVDVRPLEEWEQRTPGVEEAVADLSRREACEGVMGGVDLVFNLAADMGGMGYIEAHPVSCTSSMSTTAWREPCGSWRRTAPTRSTWAAPEAVTVDGVLSKIDRRRPARANQPARGAYRSPGPVQRQPACRRRWAGSPPFPWTTAWPSTCPWIATQVM